MQQSLEINLGGKNRTFTFGILFLANALEIFFPRCTKIEVKSCLLLLYINPTEICKLI